MRSHAFVIGLVAFAVLAGCTTKSGDSRIPVVTEAESHAAARAEVDVFIDEVYGPSVEASPGYTQYVDLPDAGTATYDGYIDGDDRSGGVPISYVANLQLTIDFATEVVTGTAYGFVTDVDGFETPEGEIEMTGDIGQDLDEVQIKFGGRGSLAGEGVDAEYWGSTGEGGYLRGDEGQRSAGAFDGNFDWSSPDWPESWADGVFRVVRQ